MIEIGIIIHYVSFIILGLGFEVPELGLNLWCIRKTANRETFRDSFPKIKQVLFVRYVLTHFVAPCCGVTVIASGLYLAHMQGYSFQTGWLFWIMVTATIGLYKGLYQHNVFIRRLLTAADAVKADAGPNEALRRAIRSPFDQALILLECPTYIFNYWIALYKSPLANPLSGWIQQLETVCSLKVLAGILIILSGILLVPVLKFLIWRFSRAQMLS